MCAAPWRRRDRFSLHFYYLRMTVFVTLLLRYLLTQLRYAINRFLKTSCPPQRHTRTHDTRSDTAPSTRRASRTTPSCSSSCARHRRSRAEPRRRPLAGRLRRGAAALYMASASSLSSSCFEYVWMVNRKHMRPGSILRSGDLLTISIYHSPPPGDPEKRGRIGNCRLEHTYTPQPR